MTIKSIFQTLSNHERYESIAIAISAMLLIWFYGCESKVPSIQNPKRNVTRAVFKMEIDSILQMAEYRYTQLDQQDAIKEALLTNALLVASGGAINPIAVVTSITAILGIGATIDNVRKRKVIKTLKS